MESARIPIGQQVALRIAILVVFLLVGMALLAVGDTWRTTASQSGFTPLAGINGLAEVVTLPDWIEPRLIERERLTAVDAIMNALSLAASTLLIFLAAPLLVAGGALLFVGGLATADWDTVVAGVVGTILGFVVPILGLLIAALTWLVALFQPCTPGYALTWVVLGLPITALASLGGGKAVTVFVYPGLLPFSWVVRS